MAGKSISSAVGLGGVNYYPDVMTVQYLLDCVPVSAGGPVRELVIDGVAGPLTIQAIQQFQKVRFGWSDGRVDPEHVGGVTIRELKEYDPLPDSPPFTAGSVPGGPGQSPAGVVDTVCVVLRGKKPLPVGKKHSGCLPAKKHSGMR